MDAVGGSADAATGGLSEANTLTGDYAESASTAADSTGGFADSFAGVSGAVVSVAGTIGGLIGTFVSYQNAQARAQKAQLAAARAAETYRKSEEAVDKLLATATSNQDAIAAARQRVGDALARVNELMKAGITSGAEFEAAQAELADAQKDLATEAGKGGVAIDKVTSALEKEELSMGKSTLATKNTGKAIQEANMNLLTMASQLAGTGGSIVQMAGSFGKVTMALRGLSGGLTAFTGVGLAGLTAALGIGAAAVGVFMGAVLALSKAPYDLILGKLDQLGKKIGETVPALSAALASTGDAFRSSLNFLTKGTTDMIKALSGIDLESKIAGKSFSQLVEEFMKFGTVGNAEVNPALDAFIKKGREMGLTDKEIIELAKQHNAEFEKVANTTKLAGVAHGLFAGAAGEATVALKENQALTEAQSAALNKVTGSALETATAVAQTGEAIARLTQADVDSITKLQEHTRAQILANAGFNNAKVAALQYEEALTTMTQSLVDDTDQKNANAQATLALVDSELNAQNAIATVNEEYANSVDRLADLNTVLQDTEARQKAVATVSNEFAASLKEQSIELEGTLQALQDVENQEQGVANAILQTKVSLEESNQALREAKAVRDDVGASSAQLQTALNEEQTALIEEEAALQASIAAANDSVIMRQRLDNAYLEGVNSIQEWNTELATSQEAEQGAIDALADLGITFSDLPGYMAPTVENLQTFREEVLGSAEAAQEMADQASEAFQTMAGDANKFIGGMKDTILEGGEKMEENWKKNWEDIPQAVRDSMGTAQQEEVKAIAQMQAAAEEAVIELGFDLNTEEFDKTRADFTANLQDLAASTDGIWSKMWSRAAELSATGSEAMLARISEIITSDDSPAIMLQHLEAAAKQFGPIGDSAGTNLMGAIGQSVSAGGVTLQSRFSEGLKPLVPAVQAIGNEIGPSFMGAIGESVTAGGVTLQSRFEGGLQPLVPKAKAIGTESGVALEQEFAKQIESIVNTINTMQLKPIPFTADVSAVHQALATLTTNPPPMMISVDADIRAAQTKIGALTGTSQKPIMIYVDANIAAAQTKLAAITTGIDSLKQSRIPTIAVNNTQAISQIRVVQTQLNAIKQTKIPTVRVNNAQAISQIKVVQTQLNAIKQTKIPKVTVNNSQALSQIARVKSALNSLKNISRTITYRYRTVGSPPRGAQSGMHERLAEDTLISAHKGERVDINPTGGPAIEKPGPTHTIYSQNGGRHGGGERDSHSGHINAR